MRVFTSFRGPVLILALCGMLGTLPSPAQQTSRLDDVLDAIIANERELATTLAQYQPLVETYLQTVKPDSTLGFVPVKDNYFFGRLELSQDQPVAEEGGKKGKSKKSKHKKTLTLLDEFH